VNKKWGIKCSRGAMMSHLTRVSEQRFVENKNALSSDEKFDGFKKINFTN